MMRKIRLAGLAAAILFSLWPVFVLLPAPPADAQVVAYDACRDATGNALLRYGRLQSSDRAPDGRRAVLSYRMRCQRDPWRESGTSPEWPLDRSNPVVADAYRQRYGRPAANTGWRFRCADERSQLIKRAYEQRHGRPPNARETEDMLATCGAGLDWRPPRSTGCPQGWECDPDLRPCDGQPGCLEVDEILDRCRASGRVFSDPNFDGCRRYFVRWRCNEAPQCLPKVAPEPESDPPEPEEPETPADPEPEPDQPQTPADPAELDEIRQRLDGLEARVDSLGGRVEDLEQVPAVPEPEPDPAPDPAPDPEPEEPQPVTLSLIPGSWVATSGDSERVFDLPDGARSLTVRAVITASDPPAGIFPGLIRLRSGSGVILELLANTRYRRTDRVLLDPHDGSHRAWAGRARALRPGARVAIELRVDLVARTVTYTGGGQTSPALRLGAGGLQGLELVLGQQRDIVNAYVRPLGWRFERVEVEVE
ncbi:MAG: hypothetical protein AAF604_04625 [Acidobacteriota bacterium]